MVCRQICVLPISAPRRHGATIAHSQIGKLDDFQGRKSVQRIQILAAPHNENSRKTGEADSGSEAILTEASPAPQSQTITHLRRAGSARPTRRSRDESDDKDKTED